MISIIFQLSNVQINYTNKKYAFLAELTSSFTLFLLMAAAALFTVFRMSSVDRCARPGKLQRFEIDTGTEVWQPLTPPKNEVVGCAADKIVLLLLMLLLTMLLMRLVLPPTVASRPGSFLKLNSKGEISMSKSSRLC